MDKHLFSQAEFDRLSNAAEILEGTRMQSSVENMLEAYRCSAGVCVDEEPDVDEYLDMVNSVSNDLSYLDSVYVNSDIEEAFKNDLMDLSSDAYLSIFRSGLYIGVDPAFDQPYDTRKDNVLEAVKIANKYI